MQTKAADFAKLQTKFDLKFWQYCRLLKKTADARTVLLTVECYYHVKLLKIFQNIIGVCYTSFSFNKDRF